jgi:hypothetical protein
MIHFPESEPVLVTIAQPYFNHLSAEAVFGPDNVAEIHHETAC